MVCEGGLPRVVCVRFYFVVPAQAGIQFLIKSEIRNGTSVPETVPVLGVKLALLGRILGRQTTEDRLTVLRPRSSVLSTTTSLYI